MTGLQKKYTAVKFEGVTGNELRELRKGLGLTQTELAKELRVAQNTIARWERDEVRIPEYLPLALQGIQRMSREEFNIPIELRIVGFDGLDKEDLKKIAEYLQFLKSQKHTSK